MTNRMQPLFHFQIKLPSMLALAAFCLGSSVTGRYTAKAQTVPPPAAHSASPSAAPPATPTVTPPTVPAGTQPPAKTDADTASPDAAPPTPKDNIRYGYTVHQSIDFGGHIVSRAGSGAMYDTLVNLQSGPRVLDFSLNLVWALPGRALLFDRLSTDSFGYGGDPNNVSTLNFSKGKLYDFRGTFRRDRQYFDYDLLANPLIPPTSAPFVPILDSPHLFNTVRRMTDLNLTLEPLARFSVRLGYAHIISQGPSFSTIHEGAEGQLMQFWRNGTDTWNGGIDWKVDPHTTVSFDEFVMHYKGDTSWQLTGLNNVLSNGTPVALGVDLSSVWTTPCAAPFAANGRLAHFHGDDNRLAAKHRIISSIARHPRFSRRKKCRHETLWLGLRSGCF